MSYTNKNHAKLNESQIVMFCFDMGCRYLIVFTWKLLSKYTVREEYCANDQLATWTFQGFLRPLGVILVPFSLQVSKGQEMPKQIHREVIFAQYLIFLLQASNVFLRSSYEQNSGLLFICPHKSSKKQPQYLYSVPSPEEGWSKH